eukprot:EG_transcript_7168
MWEKERAQWLCFGLGHVLNDLVACGWFSFFLVFLTHVLKISDADAGVLLFLGQVCDAVATPIVGVLSDHCTFEAGGEGRKRWLVVSSIMIGVVYPLLYEHCYWCEWWPDCEAELRFAYLIVMIFIFQATWAVGQVCHLALLTEIGRTAYARTTLNSIRFGATVCSNLTVFLAAFVALSSSGSVVSPKDRDRFRWLAYTVSGIGLCCTFAFWALVRVPPRNVNSPSLNFVRQPGMWWYWFLQLEFWIVGVLYMCARLIANVVQVYLQLFVVEALHMPALALALVPSTFFVGQMVASVCLPTLSTRFRPEMLFIASLALVSFGCLVTYFACHFSRSIIYAGGFVLGIGCGATMVGSMAFVADLVSTKRQMAAWVYGLMSFTDKVSGGVALLLLQRGLQGYGSFEVASGGREQFLLWTITLLPTTVALVALAAILLLVWSRHRAASKPSELQLLLAPDMAA